MLAETAGSHPVYRNAVVCTQELEGAAEEIRMTTKTILYYFIFLRKKKPKNCKRAYTQPHTHTNVTLFRDHKKKKSNRYKNTNKIKQCKFI